MISAPLRYLKAYGCLKGFVLDYHCGTGGDFFYLERNKTDLEIDPYSWDPNFLLLHSKGYSKKGNSCPWNKPSFHTILCTYVLHTMTPDERKQVIQHVQSLLYPNGSAYFTIYTHGKYAQNYTVQQLQEEIPNSTVVFKQRTFTTIEWKQTESIPQ